MSLITADNLTLMRGHTPILRHISIRVARGEAIHLTGDNGSGKTTLLQALAGLFTVHGGHIERHSNLLYLGHRPGVKAGLSVKENLQLAARLYHQMTHPQLHNQVEEAIEQVGLLKQRDRQTRFLSAGQQRRCQLARLWLNTPPLWLLDEPLTALDTHGVKRLAERCAEHCDNGGGLIITSHQPFYIPSHTLNTYSLSDYA
ncbi:heme ABC exporter ATP-binding protein CcmA [Suttonella sp. R2A3]|uniref:heme ABC exporter ATP-binding protein CcmA n=1 Tax=Suttonella sp. R2A3 TaxID=2908648 RepID=UPI001F44B6B2|nr:heme ABC exporter ATP-binding protein CcmA [Suttonella sp. R2A3]UJF24733.1 heme ABC exporter ATP-binding protein CcmA [Suttonella sp. R2A3]